MAKIVRLRDRNQITLPSDVTTELGLHENDYLVVEVTTEGIQLAPTRLVRVDTPEAAELRKRAEDDVRAGRYETHAGVEDATAALLKRARTRRGNTLKAKVAALVLEEIREAMEQAGGDRQAAAQRLGLSKVELEENLKKYHIEPALLE